MIFLLGPDLGVLGAVLARCLMRKPILLLVYKLSNEYFMRRTKKNIASKMFYRVISLSLRLLGIVNIKFSNGAVALGEHLTERISKYSDKVFTIPIYGVNSRTYRPVSLSKKINIRHGLNESAQEHLSNILL